MSLHIPCFQDQMSVSLEAGGAANNVCCFTFSGAGSLWISKHSTIPVSLNIVRTVFIFAHEGDDGIKAVARLPEKWRTKGTVVQLTLCCSSRSAERHRSSCVCSALPAAVKSRAVPWLLPAPAWHGHTRQPARHSGHGRTSTEHTCTVLLWFHRYPQLPSFKRCEINGLATDTQRGLSRIYLFQGKNYFGYGNSFAFSVQ